MLCGVMSWKQVWLAFFQMPLGFHIYQNSSSLLSNQITLIRKLVLDTKAWVLSWTNFYYNNFFQDGWRRFCHETVTIDVTFACHLLLFFSWRLNTRFLRARAFNSELYVLFNILSPLNLSQTKCCLKDTSRVTSKATLFSTAIVVWQINQRVGLVENVSHSALTQERKNSSFQC